MNFVEKPRKTSWFIRLTMSVLILLAVAASGTSYYFYRAYRELRGDAIVIEKPSPTPARQGEIQDLVATIGQFYELPDETPTVATVTDPALLRDQVFFASAKKGDKVLIFSKARKAILFDPVKNKIIEIAPLDISTNDK